MGEETWSNAYCLLSICLCQLVVAHLGGWMPGVPLCMSCHSLHSHRAPLGMQEQRFELRLWAHRTLGLNGNAGRQAVAFDFGGGGLW